MDKKSAEAWSKKRALDKKTVKPRNYDEVITERECPRCKVVWPIDNFFRDKSKKNGRAYYCKPCAALNAATAIGKLRRKEAAQRGIIRNKFKTEARKVTTQAIKAGKLTKEACFFCGETKVDAHHPLYEFPLKIMWLCRKHHMATHFQSNTRNTFEEKLTS